MNHRQKSRAINELARIRHQLNGLQIRAEQLSLQLIKHDGGESKKYIASVVRMPARIVHFKAHKQLRLVAKQTRRA